MVYHGRALFLCWFLSLSNLTTHTASKMSSEKHTQPVSSVAEADKSQPIFPLFTDKANDGFSNRGEDAEASATCLCGKVQLSVVSRLSQPLSVHSRVGALTHLPHMHPADQGSRLSGLVCVPLHRL